MQPQNITKFIEKLNDYANHPIDSIAKDVAIEALSHKSYDDNAVCNFFKDLLNYGCRCGMIGSLIYYTDTDKFFDKHYYEIMDIKESYEESMGQPMQLSKQLKNDLAWFGFEEVARQLWYKYQPS